MHETMVSLIQEEQVMWTSPVLEFRRGHLELYHGAGMVNINTGIELLMTIIPDFSCIFNNELYLTVIQRLCFFYFIFPASDQLSLVHLPPRRDVVEVYEVCVLVGCLHCHIGLEDLFTVKFN